MSLAGAHRAPVFISAPNFSCHEPTAEYMLRPRKRRRARGKGMFKTAVRMTCGAFPSPELPTFNGLYPSIVTRRVSQ
jgi:hypothetical protein